MSRRVRRRARRLVRGPAAGRVGTALLVLALAGCSMGGSSGDGDAEQAPAASEKPAVEDGAPEEAIAGSFVGEVSGTKAFVAVVAEPAAGRNGPRAVEVYVSDGRRLGERFSGSSADNSFVATSDNGRRKVEGTLSGDSVTGTVELRGGKKVTFAAGPPSGPAGLYDLTVSPDGELSGASAAGLGITGEITDEKRRRGALELVDGKRVEFDVVRNPAGPLRAGEARVIVLPGGRLRGAGTGRPASGGASDFFIRSV